MKYTLPSILAFISILASPPALYAETVVTAPALPASPFAAPQSGAKGFAVALATVAKVVNFDQIVPLTDCVISAITFPTTGPVGTYTGDTAIIGVTLKAGIPYNVFGNAVTLASGTAYLRRR